MHPAGLRCSSLTYTRYARSSRLAGQAPLRPVRLNHPESARTTAPLDQGSAWEAPDFPRLTLEINRPARPAGLDVAPGPRRRRLHPAVFSFLTGNAFESTTTPIC